MKKNNARIALATISGAIYGFFVWGLPSIIWYPKVGVAEIVFLTALAHMLLLVLVMLIFGSVHLIKAALG